MSFGYKLGKSLRKGVEAVSGTTKKAIQTKLKEAESERAYRQSLRKQYRKRQIREEVRAEFKKPKRNPLEDLI